MTTFTTIPNSSLEPGKPIRAIDGLALRDNPIAMFEGDASAPKLQDAALGPTVTTGGTSWVLNRTAGAAVGALGSYAFATRPTNSGSTPGNALSPGATVAGSVLRYSNIVNDQSSALTGTWRCMGFMSALVFSDTEGLTTTTYRATLFLRIT